MLLGLALRMTGNIGDAEDAVQEAYVRLATRAPDEIGNVRSWLVVVTSRLCLDQLRSAEARRVEPADDVGAPPAFEVDVADRVTLDDNVRLAMLVVLERLSPAERVVFVLHDVFQMPFPAIAETVGRTPEACRQLASRARRHVREDGATPRFTADVVEHEAVAERFIAACAGADMEALLRVLDPDVVGVADRSRFVRFPPIRGSRRVGKRLIRLFGRNAKVTLVPAPDTEQPGVIVFQGRQIVGLLTFELSEGRIHHIHALVDRRRLAPLTARLSSPEAD